VWDVVLMTNYYGRSIGWQNRPIRCRSAMWESDLQTSELRKNREKSHTGQTGPVALQEYWLPDGYPEGVVASTLEEHSPPPALVRWI
jgi:hypothetical protein